MRVLHIIESLGPGGKERRLLELLKGFSSHSDIETYLIILSENIHYKELDDLSIKTMIIKRKSIGNIKTFYNIYKYCKENKIEIIHSWAGFISLYSGIISRILNIKLVNAMVTSASEVKFPSKKWLYSRTSFPLSDIILSNSQAGLKAFKAPKNKSKYIHNGFNFSRIENLEPMGKVRDRFDIKTDLIVGMVATFSENKDYDTFLKASSEITDLRKDITFLCIGEGVLYEHYRNIYDDNELIKFLGNQEDIEAIVNIFDIGVLSTKCESLPNSILEYMALSKPVIATDAGGIPELVLNKVSGFLFENGNSVELRDQIIRLIDDTELRKIMGKKSRSIVENKFKIDNMVSGTKSIYIQLLGDK